MKNKIGLLLSIISIIIISTYVLVVNINIPKEPRLIDISGDRQSLDNVELLISKNKDRYSYDSFIINKDGVTKEKSYYDWNMIINRYIEKDKRFYRDSSDRFDEVYEGQDSRFSARFNHKKMGDGTRVIEINYKNKETNEYINFDVTVPNTWVYIYGVYSEGDTQKIIIEGSGELWKGDVIIADVDLNNKTITSEYEVNLSNKFNDKVKLDYLNNNGKMEVWNSAIFDDVLYLIAEFSSESNNNAIIAINIVNGTAEKYNYNIDKLRNSISTSLKDNDVYTYTYDNKELNIVKFNVVSKNFKEYTGIKLPQMVNEEEYGIGISNLLIKDNQLILSCYGWINYKQRDYLVGINLDTNTTEYVGEVEYGNVYGIN